VVVDLCTGSGAIALSVAQEVPQARVHAVELSPDAYAWAARNAAGTSLDLRLGDAADAFPTSTAGGRRREQPAVHPGRERPLDPEVRDHDPAVALWSGPGRPRRRTRRRAHGRAAAAARRSRS
jgi:release factor glutamine methyltransferase